MAWLVCCVVSFGLMNAGVSQLLIGYSVFDIGEECCEDNENACFIATTLDSAKRVLSNASMAPQAEEFHPVS